MNGSMIVALYANKLPPYSLDVYRYSTSTIAALESMDDDKIDLDLIAVLIRYIALEEEVSFCLV